MSCFSCPFLIITCYLSYGYLWYFPMVCWCPCRHRWFIILRSGYRGRRICTRIPCHLPMLWTHARILLAQTIASYSLLKAVPWYIFHMSQMFSLYPRRNPIQLHVIPLLSWIVYSLSGNGILWRFICWTCCDCLVWMLYLCHFPKNLSGCRSPWKSLFRLKILLVG